MTTKELIVTEVGKLSEKELNELYGIIKRFAESKKPVPSPGLMSKIKRVQINAPSDFAANLDLYVSGEKRAQ